MLNAPAKIASYWYSENGRAIATTVCSIANPIGVAIGFLFPSFFIDDDDEGEIARQHIQESFFYQAIIGTVLGVVCLIFFRSKPPTPPSNTADGMRDPFGKSVRELFGNKNFLVLLVVFGGVLGVFNTLGTVISEIGNAYEYTTDDFSMFGALFIVGGVIGSFVFGVYVDVTKRFQKSVLLICCLSVVTFGAFMIVINLEIALLVAAACAFVGGTMVPILPVGFEYAIEITYPIGEAMSAGVLMSAG